MVYYAGPARIPWVWQGSVSCHFDVRDLDGDCDWRDMKHHSIICKCVNIHWCRVVSLVLNFLCCAAKNVMNLWSAIGDACAVTAGCGNFWVLLAVRLVLPDFFFFLIFLLLVQCVLRVHVHVWGQCILKWILMGFVWWGQRILRWILVGSGSKIRGYDVMRLTYIEMDPHGLWKK